MQMLKIAAVVLLAGVIGFLTLGRHESNKHWGEIRALAADTCEVEIMVKGYRVGTKPTRFDHYQVETIVFFDDGTISGPAGNTSAVCWYQHSARTAMVSLDFRPE